MIPFSLRIIVSDQSFAFYDVSERVSKAMGLILTAGHPPYLDLDGGPLVIKVFDVVQQIGLNIGCHIPYMPSRDQKKAQDEPN